MANDKKVVVNDIAKQLTCLPTVTVFIVFMSFRLKCLAFVLRKFINFAAQKRER